MPCYYHLFHELQQFSISLTFKLRQGKEESPILAVVESPMASYFAVQLLSCVQLFATPRTAAHQASLSFTIAWSLLKLMSIELVMPSNHLILSLITWTFEISFPAGVRERKEKRQRGFDTWRTCTPAVSWLWRESKRALGQGI